LSGGAALPAADVATLAAVDVATLLEAREDPLSALADAPAEDGTAALEDTATTPEEDTPWLVEDEGPACDTDEEGPWLLDEETPGPASGALHCGVTVPPPHAWSWHTEPVVQGFWSSQGVPLAAITTAVQVARVLGGLQRAWLDAVPTVQRPLTTPW
jgi:hypothetical protein